MHFAMWCGRDDASPETRVWLMIETRSSEGMLFIYTMNDVPGDMKVSVELGSTTAEDIMPLARISESDLDDAIALCQDMDYRVNTSYPLDWVASIIREMYYRSIISTDEAHIWRDLHNTTVHGTRE
ncbi:hypothetical protein NLG97_g6699 [Lecanicillium saksenae]|uniref:Uncharacterized protein n=1 Tax=Lecanicillium saksenae TaxID=468837 RepID=A0ACC1QNX1_9HYPO|nr:hypothetical protein NLG97_g6699 [Lecanicillium saksenae]